MDRTATTPSSVQTPPQPQEQELAATQEVGGPPGPEPTRFGDWEQKGRCVDF